MHEAGLNAESAGSLEAVYRRDGRRIFATLVRLLGSFERAEEAEHDAFIAAAEQWPRDGVPANPVAWLVSVGRFKAIDRLRRDARFASIDDHLDAIEHIADPDPAQDEQEAIGDDRLRLIFTCCHPSLSEESRVALTLREVCGLATEEIARAYLTSASTLAQRIVRAKAKIRDARIPYEVPEPGQFASRLDSVLRVVYLVFNEGYSASSGEQALRLDLAAEAIRLGWLVVRLCPQPEARGLLALMLLHHGRRRARTDAAGDLIPLEEQDRSLWDAGELGIGRAMAADALRQPGYGGYALQAAIVAVHTEAATVADTDWAQIVGLYDRLLQREPSPVVALNRAVAIAMRDGPQAGLALIEPMLTAGPLHGYHLTHAAHADLCRRAGRRAEARFSYERALGLARQEPERRFLRRRLGEIGS
ncbi:MAG: RNA polymerase sigma factor [Acidisphaera sp.]|nr:RNA polymerase sigma factor [Acidisphaera sp.]MBV9811475.1 RNA polymerase sigma factor [Acetobacteraceae bacterium]